MESTRLVPAILLATAGFALGGEYAIDFKPASQRSALRAEAVREASGLAVSSRSDGFLWVINDSGSTPTLHLIDSEGQSRGQMKLASAVNTDWEDLASFTLDGKPFLLVADTGDNESKRGSCTLYILREPELPAAGKNLDGTAEIAWKIRFCYKGGPRDCESVAVDGQGKKILLLSKRTRPPEVHELPLHPDDLSEVQTTRRIGVTSVSAPADSLVPFRDQPTGMDISADHSLAAVVTYYGVFVFHRQPGEDWAKAFSGKPKVLEPHCLAQAESIAFTKDGHRIIVVSEGRNSPIAIYQKPGT